MAAGPVPSLVRIDVFIAGCRAVLVDAREGLMTSRTAVAFAILLCIAIQVGAGDRSVAPWEWTRADRLERRYDPALAAERRRTSTHCRSGCGD